MTNLLTATDIVQLRAALGENRRDFADHFNVSRPTIYHWEKHGPPNTGANGAHVRVVVEALRRRISGGDGDVAGATVDGGRTSPG